MLQQQLKLFGEKLIWWPLVWSGAISRHCSVLTPAFNAAILVPNRSAISRRLKPVVWPCSVISPFTPFSFIRQLQASVSVENTCLIWCAIIMRVYNDQHIRLCGNAKTYLFFGHLIQLNTIPSVFCCSWSSKMLLSNSKLEFKLFL